MATINTSARIARIRIEWGGFTAYLDSGLFPQCWDGGAQIAGGKLIAAWQLEFKLAAHHFAVEHRVPMVGSSWRSQTDNGLGGVLLEVAGGPDTQITIITTPITVSFRLSELIRDKYRRWPVGAKYAGIAIFAMLDGEGPFEINGQVQPGCLDVRIPSSAFHGLNRNAVIRQAQFKTTEAAWVPPGKSAGADFALARSPSQGRRRQSAFELECRLALAAGPKTHYNEAGTEFSPVAIRLNGRLLPLPPVYFRREQASWKETQWIEFVTLPVPNELLKRGCNRLEIGNGNRKLFLAITGAQLRESLLTDGAIQSAPAWLLAGQPFEVKLYCLRRHENIRAHCRNAQAAAPIERLDAGEQRLKFIAGNSAEQAEITLYSGNNILWRIEIPVFNVRPEPNKWLVGAMLEHVRLDDSRQADWIIRYFHDTQLGNYVQFRIEPTNPQRCNATAARPEDWRRWGGLLNEYGIYFSILSGHAWKGYNLDGYTEAYQPAMDACRHLKDAAGKFFFSTHVHEYSRSLYGAIPRPNTILPPAANTMTAAAGRFRRAVAAIEGYPGVPMQIGEAAPMAADDYDAGIEYVAVETMALHTLHLFAAASGAARVYGKTWGIHNATYWCKAPDDFTKLALNYINWHLAYMWGGRFVISEDGHFSIPHSNRQQQFHSEFPVKLRQQLREFYKFVNIHPRRGFRETPIAIARGNGSCELLSFPLKVGDMRSCIRRIWGMFGASTPEWEYGDPERGLELMDVFMPYAQDGHHLRHWFAGTPYGPFDLTPIAQTPDHILADYPLLVFLGWNTMTPAIYRKLINYVRNGGTLFCALPHFSRHAGRGFLSAMEDLKLIHDGDLRELCGISVKGAAPAAPVSAAWLADGDREAFRRHGFRQYPLGTRPAPMRMADVTLRGARMLAADPTGKIPALVEHRLGKGRVWLLTAWTYPGHTACMPLVKDALHLLADRARQKASAWVEDPSNEVAHACWRDGSLRTLFLLNTDWTAEHNTKHCVVHIGGHAMPLAVREREIRALTWRNQLAVLPDDTGVYVESITHGGADYRIILHGRGKIALTLFSMGQPLRRVAADQRNIRVELDETRTRAACRLDFGRRTRMELRVRF